MARTPEEQRFRAWERYVASIPYAVARYREAHPTLSENAVQRYEEGMHRYARILEREAGACTKIKRQR